MPQTGGVTTTERIPNHRAYFYGESLAATARISVRVLDTISSGGAQVVILLPLHLVAVERQLASSGLDLDALRRTGRYIGLDASLVLEQLQLGEPGDDARFEQFVAAPVERLAANHDSVMAYGEMVAILAAEGRFQEALRLESFWTDLCRRTGLSLECGYWLKDFRGEAGLRQLLAVCGAHSDVEPTEEYDDVSRDLRLRSVVVLQHRAQIAREALERQARAEERLRRALDAERKARRRAEQALAERDRFLDAAAHELRTPLTGVLGSLQLLVRRCGRAAGVAREQKLLNDAASQADRMRRVIDGLLNARSVEEPLRLRRRSVEIRSLLQETVDRYNLILAWSRVSLVGGEGLTARVDPKRVDQMLWNLIDNAVRFSSPGLPVEVRAELDDYGFRIVVSDRGPGIPLDSRARVFERYEHAQQDGSFGGMGLGLYVCHQIVEAHGGLMSLGCPLTGGTVVTVQLPLAARPRKTELPEGTSAVERGRA